MYIVITLCIVGYLALNTLSRRFIENGPTYLMHYRDALMWIVLLVSSLVLFSATLGEGDFLTSFLSCVSIGIGFALRDSFHDLIVGTSLLCNSTLEIGMRVLLVSTKYVIHLPDQSLHQLQGVIIKVGIFTTVVEITIGAQKAQLLLPNHVLQQDPLIVMPKEVDESMK